MNSRLSLKSSEVIAFQAQIRQFYHTSGRHDLLWRQPNAERNLDPYIIVVSEIMLQQTQVSRVTTKLPAFLAHFPTVNELAAASFADVLREWSGLGYNRRAKFLHQTAQRIVTDFNGHFPEEVEMLSLLPGIGKNTAGAVVAYSFNKPVVFIETNIRTVYLHHFFADRTSVSDKEILALVEATLDPTNPRQWYWALMDYGSYLKNSLPNPGRRSQHYTKQTAFHGSRRQIRGAVLKLLLESPCSLETLKVKLADTRLESVLEDLVGEGLVSRKRTTYSLGK